MNKVDYVFAGGDNLRCADGPVIMKHKCRSLPEARGHLEVECEFIATTSRNLQLPARRLDDFSHPPMREVLIFALILLRQVLHKDLVFFSSNRYLLPATKS